MQWSLEDVYKKQVRGNIPQRKHLGVLGESIAWGPAKTGNLKDVESVEDIREYGKKEGLPPEVVADLENSWEEKNKIEVEYGKEEADDFWFDIQAGIKTAPVGHRIKHYLGTKGWKDTELKRYSREMVSTIIGHATEGDPKIEQLKDYLNNPDTHPEFKLNARKGNLLTELRGIPVDNGVIEDLMKHKSTDQSLRGIGMGELAMTLFFRNITAASKKGDLGVETATAGIDSDGDGKSNEEFEIKGHNAALGPTGDTVPMPPASFANLGGMGWDVQVKQGKGEGDKKDHVSGKDYNKKKHGNVGALKPRLGEKRYDANNLAEAISDAYNSVEDRVKFIKEFKNILKTNFGKDWNDQVAGVYNSLNWDSEDLVNEINTIVALMNFVRYATLEQFRHFMVHDFGSRGKATKTDLGFSPSSAANSGEYVYVSGSPLEMAQQISDQPEIYFQPISFSNARPKVGLETLGGQEFGVPQGQRRKFVAEIKKKSGEEIQDHINKA